MAVASASVVVPIAAVSIVLLGIIYLCVHFAYHAILIIYATAVRLTARLVLERADLGGACGRKWVVSI
jgi:hypothetical protein